MDGNDGLRGFPPFQIEQNLVKAITLSQQAGAQPLLMQIRRPPNYGKRYTEIFSAIYPTLASRYVIYPTAVLLYGTSLSVAEVDAR